jgi:catechol 2,3-dioxygenase-like lactoylglutathione lyase family enzyme
MTFSLDHIVIAVRDLDRAIADYGKLGFTVLCGGEHPRGTANALIAFEDGSYFELIGFPRPVPGFRWWEVLQKAGPGFVDFAILAGDLETDLRDAQAKGFATDKVEPGARIRPDGVRVAWQTARAPTSDVPFLCADITPRPLRIPDGDARNHPNGALGVSAITVAVRDLATSLVRYRALLPEGLQRDRTEYAASFICGPAIIQLLQPEIVAPGMQEVAAHLQNRGEGPFAVTLRGSQAVRFFDPVLTRGARLNIRPG